MFFGFPHGTCGPATELIGRLLQERMGLLGVCVTGNDHPGLTSADQSHAWFEVDDWIIDIARDQFEGTSIAGWVVPVNSTWYGQFRSIDRRRGFCMPSGWPTYPYDGYAAMSRALGSTAK